MIYSLNGRVIENLGDSALIELGGIGFRVYIPEPTLRALRIGEKVFLHTYLVVREDALTLFGFENPEERDLFVLLLGVNGVGPRSALSVLTTLTADAVRRAVFHKQAEVLNRVPGIGKKTAQKILLHLQDRLATEEGLEAVTGMSDIDTAVIEALTALGYSVVEAQAALQSVPPDASQEVEEKLRLALKYFA